MNLRYNSIYVLLFAVIFSGNILYSQEMDEKKSDPEMIGFCAEFIGQVHFVQGRLVELQKAVPEEKYSWRPAEGVRSLGEVYTHASMANYYFIKFAGYEVPKDINMDLTPDEWDKMTMGKSEITKVLERSFADLLATAQKITESDLEKNVHAFGMDMTLRNFMISSLNHMHEHLGQSIAYARSNGVTPPWSEKAPSEEK